MEPAIQICFRLTALKTLFRNDAEIDQTKLMIYFGVAP